MTEDQYTPGLDEIEREIVHHLEFQMQDYGADGIEFILGPGHVPMRIYESGAFNMGESETQAAYRLLKENPGSRVRLYKTERTDSATLGALVSYLQSAGKLPKVPE